MNRRQAISAITLLLIAPAFGEDINRENDNDYKTYIIGLPACDRIEVIRIGQLAGESVPIEGSTDTRRVLPDDKTNLYHVEPYDEWWTIAARITLNGPEAERIAALYRGLKPRYDPHHLIGGPLCHVPPYAYLFYSGDKLLYHTSICWGCENIIVGPDGKRHYFYFATKAKEAVKLFDESKKLFHDAPVK